jgi:hypothetical protein
MGTSLSIDAAALPPILAIHMHIVLANDTGALTVAADLLGHCACFFDKH